MNRFGGPSRFIEANPWLQEVLLAVIVAAIVVYLFTSMRRS